MGYSTYLDGQAAQGDQGKGNVQFVHLAIGILTMLSPPIDRIFIGIFDSASFVRCLIRGRMIKRPNNTLLLSVSDGWRIENWFGRQILGARAECR